MKVLVTGGSGRLAGYVAREFADHQAVLTDLRPPPADRAHLSFVAGDLTGSADCRRVGGRRERRRGARRGGLRSALLVDRLAVSAWP